MTNYEELWEEAARAGLRLKRQLEIRDERIDVLRRACARLRGEMPKALDAVADLRKKWERWEDAALDPQTLRADLFDVLAVVEQKHARIIDLSQQLVPMDFELQRLRAFYDANCKHEHESCGHRYA